MEIDNPVLKIKEKNVKLKTYVLTISKNFLHYHPKAGEATRFKDKILSGEKKHTIRGNYNFWKKRIDAVAQGKAVLSVREWSGKPYHSVQNTITEFTSKHGVGIQKVTARFKGENTGSEMKIEGLLQDINDVISVAENDGLSEDDFLNWFNKDLLDGAIIHFSDFRY